MKKTPRLFAVSLRVNAWTGRLRRHSSRAWFAPVAGMASALDSFAPLMPTQTLLVTLGALHPRRWLATGLWFALGGAAGGALLAIVVETWIPAVSARFAGGAADGAVWPSVQRLVNVHGAWALFGLTLAPWPMRTGVVLCALAGVPWFEIALALGAGRAVAFPGLAWMAGRSPALLKRWGASLKDGGARGPAASAGALAARLNQDAGA